MSRSRCGWRRRTTGELALQPKTCARRAFRPVRGGAGAAVGHSMYVHAGGGLPPSRGWGSFVDRGDFSESDGERGGLARRCGSAAERRMAVGRVLALQWQAL